MRPIHRILLTVAIGSWLGAAAAHVVAQFGGARERWETRRNLCLLLSSICMNTLVASVGVRYLARRGSGRST
jgi:predicted membrane protein